MNVYLMANEKSGGGTDVEDLRRQLMAAGADLVDAPAAAERIVVASGDGAIAPAAALAAEHGVPLAVVPAGTANDFANANRIPEDWDAAVALAVKGTATRPHELGCLDDRPFVNVASAGLGPSAARRAAPLKKLLGPVAYPV